MSIETLVDLLRRRAVEKPEALAYRFLLTGDADGPVEEWTYGELDRRARLIGARLQAAGAAGERALLLYPPGLEFIAAFLGCACAGVTAVPTYPHRTLSRLESIVQDSRSRFVLTTGAFLKISQSLKRQAPGLAEARWITTDGPAEQTAEDWRPPQISGATLAFLQYTSGSTGRPKGVMVSHANVLENQRVITRGFGTDESIHVVGWLPLYHDMGLIGNVLHTVYLGASCTLMSPLAFLQRPLRWLEAIARFRGTVSGGPNFAYDLCVNKKRGQQFDLSSWKVAFNGAEPVRRETLERFASAFADSGFQPRAFYPCYGLAEATLFVTGAERDEPPVYRTVRAEALERNRAVETEEDAPGARTLVSSGRSQPELRVEIVDPEKLTVCGENTVGEIWVSGGSVAGGYWDKPEESERVFHARLAGENGARERFLRTGDLGFVANGELYVTGRLKDLIIIRGRNLYPQDIEYTAQEAHAAVRAAGCAAFALEIEGEEKLALVAEVSLREENLFTAGGAESAGDSGKTREGQAVAEEQAEAASSGADAALQAIAEAVRRAVAEEHGVHAHTVVLIRVKSIPKTSSGKIRRDACRKDFLSGDLPVLTVSAVEEPAAAVELGQQQLSSSSTEAEAGLARELELAGDHERLPLVERMVRARCAKYLRVAAERVDLNSAPASLGLDSLMGLELQNEIEQELELSLAEGFLWQHATLGESAGALLALWERQRSAGSEDEIQAAPLEGDLPVSSGQQRLWFLDRLQGGSPEYNLQFGLRISGDLDEELLRASLSELIRRHASLRTGFRQIDGQPRQFVQAAMPAEIAAVDLSSVPAAESDEALRKTAFAIAVEPFDLGRAPLARFHLLSLRGGERLLLVTQHHIITDGWSIMLMGRELAALYSALAQQAPLPPPPPLQFADYARWEQALLPQLEDERRFWAERLQGLPRLELPTDRPRPARRSSQGGRLMLDLGPELSRRLVALGRAEACTPFVVLAAGYAVFLLRHTGQREFPLGSFVANRGRAELRHITGFFANTVVLRCGLEGRPTFRQLLARMRAVVAETLRYGRLPFSEVVQLAGAEGDSEDNPLFQASFILENNALEELRVPGMVWQPLVWSPDGSAGALAKFELGLALQETVSGFNGALEYSGDLYEIETVQRMIERLLLLLEGIAAHPDQAVVTLPVLAEAERRQLLVEWNQTRKEYARESCLHALFEQQAARTPQALAVICARERLTYAELDRRANRLAHYLRRLGVGPEARAGVLVERGAPMIVALLAVLKAGGAYVPLDPEYPSERLGYMLEDAQASVVLAEEHLLDCLPGYAGTVVYLDRQKEEIESESSDVPPPLAVPQNLAYLIYTSGSTGRPKAVAIAHRSAAVLLAWAHREFSPAELACVLASTSICFDLSVFEIFAPLTCGGRALVVSNVLALTEQKRLEEADADVDADAGAKTDAVRLTLINTVPSAMRELLTAQAVPTSVRTINLAGEALPAPLVREIYKTLPVERVLNLYGPSEDTTYSTCAQLPRDAGNLVVPIGRPIANTLAYVLDEEMEPMPLGVPGELYLGGDGLARGYLGHPELTAEKFVPDPFSAIPGERLYRTGDRVRYFGDGHLEFLGRLDQQVKVRGFRVELGEIEAALEQHPAVLRAVVIAHADSGAVSLVAYVQPRDLGLPMQELRDALEQRLPAYMVPAAFMMLEDMPLTPNGKIDRKALPHPDLSAQQAVYVAPRTPAEIIVAQAWTQVLGLDRVGIYDDFFSLGGHSLLVLQVLSRIQALSGVELTVFTMFKSPTVAGLAEHIESAGGVGRPVASPIVPRPRTGDLPLSFAQHRLWFLDQLDPGQTTYNMPGAVRIRGPLNVEILKRSLREIVRRHEALRTHFEATAGDPRQVIHHPEEICLDMPLFDLSFLAEADYEEEIARLAGEEARKPFDLGQAPLLRTVLLRRNPEDHALLVTMHHIVSDEWSLGLLMRELSAFYGAFLDGRTSPLPELEIQYADYSAWQREWFSSGVLEAQMEYWRTQLHGLVPLELPADHARPAVMSQLGAVLDFEIDASVTDKLKSYSQQQGATLYMTLLAAFQTLLSRYSGQTEIAVGTPVAGRTRLETESLIGFFVNTLVLRTDLSGDPGFTSLLRQVRETTLQAYANQDLPFEKLVETLAPQRDLNRTPLFQVMFALQNAPRPDLRLGAARLAIQEVPSGTAKFEIELMMEEKPGGELRARAEYSADLFTAATMARMMEHFRLLLAGIAADPEQPVAALPLLSPAERRQLLVEWNDTAVPVPLGICFPQQFERQVERAPERLAVVQGGRRWSYRELNQHANRMAGALRRHGVGRETVVALLMERGIELLASMLAVWKAGGAYLPLDPQHPALRQRQVLEQSQARFAICARALSGPLEESLAADPAENNLRIFYIEDSSLWENESGENPPPINTPGDLAYVIYTSGSTGLPKGAMVEHRGMVNHLYAKIRDLGLGPGDTIAETASQCFDISVWQFLAALLLGGHTLVVAEEVAADPVELLACTAAENITVLEIVPSLLRAMLEEIDSRRRPAPALESLRWLVLTGEALPPELSRRWLERYPRIPVLNAYGPTECSDDVTHYAIAQPPVTGAVYTPIGRAIINTRLYVLDPLMHPAPVGVPGELYVGGVCVGRGYLNDPLRTAQSFVPDPFGDGEHSRLYRTGDLVRRLPGGEIVFLGRLDHQVKVRGFRIELGEIEAALEQQPEIVQAVVMVREDSRKDKRLIGYVTRRAEITAEELRQRIKQRLPEYMTPAAIVMLEAMPLTSNGKIDRSRLPAPVLEETTAAHVAPRTPVEEMMAGIWGEVLGVGRIGVEDDFFALGGHSLLATQVMARVRSAFGIEMPLRALFEAPTVAALAEQVERVRGAESYSVPPIERIARDADLPLSFAQQRLWFLNQLEPESASYNMPGVVRFRGPLDVDLLQNSVREVARRHESLRTRFVSIDGNARQVIDDEVRLAMVLMDLASLPENERASETEWLALEEARKPFDLSQGPLLRTTLLRCGAEDHVLLVTMHHIISDGWSLKVLLREVSALYRAFSSGATSPLEELPVQYVDYSAWQRSWLKGEVLERQVSYWKDRLRGAAAALDMPVDHPRPSILSSHGAQEPVRLEPELAGSLRHLARRQGATMYMTLLAAFQILLYRYSGHTDISVGSPIAGRTHTETEDLIGFFVNTLVMRAELDGRLRFSETLQSVKETTLGAYAHQDVPFEKLVEVLAPRRDLSRTPLFQVMFDLDHEPLPELQLGPVNLQPVEISGGTAQFELSLTLIDAPDHGIRGNLEYSTDLFDPATAARMVQHYRTLVQSIAENPECEIGSLAMLTADERRQLLVEWNSTAADVELGRCFHQVFEQQAERAPERTAVVEDGRRTTYRELNRQANRLSHYLRKRGVGPESVVALLMGRGVELVASILAVFKAGGAYLPLDPGHPAFRHEQVLKRSGARHVIAARRLAKNLEAAEIDGLEIFHIEDQGSLPESFENPPPVSRPGHLAYIIYTSGSTGVPKGAMVEHLGMLNHLYAMMRDLQLGSDDIIAQTASQCFDISVWQLLNALITGGAVRIVSEEIATDPMAILRHVASERITVLQIVPSVARAVLEEIESGRMQAPELPALRWLLLTGEGLAPDLLRRWLDRYPGVPVINAYGPAECSDDVTLRAFDAALPHDAAYTPIGRPIINTRLYLLDEAMQPVPIGVVGELYVGGLCVGRGYLNDPEKTAQAFLPDIYAGENGASRLYRTGDLARQLPGGEFVYLGRTDHQVKVRGFRIELGEIEAALAEQPEVLDAVVVVHEDQAGGQRLVAYVVPRRQAVSAGDLRNALKQRLPDYMAPAVFVMLEELPLTPNGKIDRQALPVPEISAAVADYIAPSTPAEEMMAQIWASVLGVERIGAGDDFFALGGHSLLATQVMARVHSGFGVEIPLRVMFEASTLAALSQRVEQLRGAGPSRPPIKRRPRTADLPLSFAQQRLWFLDQLEPESATYNVPGGVRILGPLNEDALRRSLLEIVRRHESLRTRFAAVRGEPLQIIDPMPSLELEIVDKSSLPPQEHEAEAEWLARQDAQRPFDLARGPLIRASLVRLTPRHHVLLLNMHHIISDGWSVAVLLRELSVLYEAFSAGRPSPLPEMAIQYADFSAWQRSWLRGEVLERQLEYWKKQLAGAPPALELPLDFPRPAAPGRDGAVMPVRLEPEFVDGLRQVCRGQGATLYMGLMAAFQALLFRYSGQRDISVGTPIAGRTQSETQDLIGCLVNTLVIRTQIGEDQGFAGLLRRVKEVTLEAYAHQDVPFEKLVEVLGVQRDLGRTPLFQVMFVMQNVPPLELRLGDVELQTFEPESGTAKFELLLSLEEEGGHAVGAIEFNTSLFERATIARMVGHFRRLLSGIAGAPDLPLAHVPLLGDVERGQLLVEWNRTAAEYSQGWVHEMFQEHARRTPHAPAVEFEGQRLTYAELDRGTSQLAHYLRKLGAGPDMLVGVCMERSLELVIALLGVMKSGSAYVPMDPGYPPGRLSYMFEDAKTPVVLTQQRLIDRLPVSTAHLVPVDAAWPLIGAESASAPAVQLQPDNLVYMIYTSGSTGRPKGAMNTHKGLRNRLLWIQNNYPLKPSDRVLQKTPFSFDVSVWEFFWPLTSGAVLVVAKPGGHQDPDYLGDIIATAGITTLHFVPSMLNVFLESEGVKRCASVRRVICSGEALGAEAAKRCMERIPAELLNLYGPTEASIEVTYWNCGPSGLEKGVPIGKPIANTQVYVLDEEMEPAPIGVTGEIYLGGVGLARGYWDRPDLTAEKFVPNPFSPLEGGGERLYRTGDWGRWRTDGNVEYIGRRDEQVKLRGFRIELGEIEAALAQHENIKDAVVLVRADGHGDKRLVAWVVPRQGTISAAGLRGALKQRLPEYMVPGVFVMLESMPLTPNGKIDRKALPGPESAGTRAAGYVAPRTPVEQILCDIWAEVLGAQSVGIHDNFFELGGHSLLATQVMARLRSSFGIDLPLRLLFESSTIAALAEEVERARADKTYAVPPIVKIERGGPLPLSFAQQRLWFIDQLEPGSVLYSFPAGLRIQGPLDVDALRRSLSEVARRHESLRTRFVKVQGEPYQVIDDPGAFESPVIDLSAMEEERRRTESKRLMEEEALMPFDLARGPVLRMKLLKLADQDHLLLLTIHHIVTDAWSMGILASETSALYNAFTSGQPSPLPEPPVQYADFSAWQRNWLQGDVLESQLEYWRNQLAGVPSLALPFDRPSPEAGHSGASLPWRLDAGLTEDLARLSRKHSATLYMTTLAAFQWLLHRYTGQHDISVGSAIAGRTQAETEGLIGFFINTLVMRTRLAEAWTFEQLLLKVKETTLEAYAHQDVPFEKLVQELVPHRDVRRPQLFQVTFNMQNVPDTVVRLGGTQLELLEMETGTAKFDFSVFLEEANGGIEGAVVYNTGLFDEATITGMLRRYEILLREIVRGPARRLTEFSILDDAERRQLSSGWCGPAPAHDLQPEICGSIATRAASAPDAVAVIAGAETLTWRDLDRQANQLAHRLRAHGVEAGSRVGVCLERPCGLLKAAVAVLKSGAVFVPLAPDGPPARAAYIAKDAELALIVTEDRLASRLPETVAGTLCIDRESEEIVQESVDAPAVTVNRESLAALLYPSGPGGAPIGVPVQHLALGSLGEQLRISSSDRVAHSLDLARDAAWLELLAVLAAGACVVVIPAGPEPEKLAALVRDHDVSVLLASSRTVKKVAADEPDALTGLRSIFCDGPIEALGRLREALAPELAEKIHGACGVIEVGGTLMVHRLAAIDQRTHWAPLDHARAGATFRLLDSELEPVPDGVPGEICVAAETLSPGYVNDPVLTAALFLPDPYSEIPGARIYRTGDFARHRANGSLEYLGRRDGRGMINGVRVERREIEAALLRHPDVGQAAVVAREVPEQEDFTIAAFVVAAGPQPVDVAGLRTILQDWLPPVMLPSSIASIDEIPRAFDGAIDYRSLLNLLDGPAMAASSYIAPRTPTEEALAVIWKETLDIERAGMHDNFFELGGHSVLATLVVAQISDTLNVDIPVRKFLEAPTISQLAQLVDQASAAGAASQAESPVVVAVQAQGAATPFFCVHPVGGDVLCYVDLSREIGLDQPFYGLQSPSRDSMDDPPATIEQMAALYNREVRRMQPHGPYLLGGWSMGGIVAFEMARQFREEGESVALLALFDTILPPKHRKAAGPGADLSVLASFALDMCNLLGKDPLEMSGRFLQSGEDEQRKMVLDMLQKEGALPQDPVRAEKQMNSDLEIFMRNHRAIHDYSLQRTGQRIALFPAAEEAGREGLAEEWREWAGGVEAATVPGDHYSMFKRPNVAALGQHLRQYIGALRRKDPAPQPQNLEVT